jgi:tropomodulin
MKYIHDQAKNMPDRVDSVSHVPGLVLGKVWVDPNIRLANEAFDYGDLDLGDEIEMALDDASTQDMVDLAGIMGLHSMINQDQYHHAVGAKANYKEMALDEAMGWDGITKATPLKCYPAEPPNLTDPVDVLEKIRAADEEQTAVNLNNVEVSEQQMLDIFDALRGNEVLSNLSVANTNLTDWAAANLCHTLECNKALESLNIESNNVRPQTLAKMFESMNVQESVTELKAMNQAAQVLGNKVEMSIAKSVENNKTLLKVGMQFEFNDCRDRVNVATKKNMDRVRLKRIAEALAERMAFDPCAGLRSVMPSDWIKARAVEEEAQEAEVVEVAEEEDEYDYYTDDEEEEVVKDMGPPAPGRPHVPYPIDLFEEE